MRLPLLAALLIVAAPTACTKERAVYRADPDPGQAPRARRGAVGSGATATARTPASAPGTSRPLVDKPTPEAFAHYVQRCAGCHGDKGRGDGPAAVMLNPRPKSFADAAWQTRVSDEHLRRTILLGGMAVGLSPAMPSSPDLEHRAALLAQLVGIVRSFEP